MGDYFRLRHIAIATPDFERSRRDIATIFGVQLAFEDPHVAHLGIVNAMFPFGLSFIEVMAPTSADAPSARFLERSGGRGGYLLCFNCSDPRRRAEHAKALGIKIIAEFEYDTFWGVQLHPRDCRAVMIEFDETQGGEDVNGPMYPAGGTGWREHVRTDETKRIVEVIVESPEPHDLGAHWSKLLELPYERLGDGGLIRVDMSDIRFAKGAAGSKELLAAIRLEVRDPAAVLGRAAALGYEVTDDAVKMCGVRFVVR